MEFIAPIPFNEAIQKLGAKSIIGSQLTSAEWQDVPAELRDRAFFSSQVESAQVLQRARDLIGDFLAGNRMTTEDGQTLLKVGSRAAFVDQMQSFLAQNGIERTDGGITDITSGRRLGLIFDTQTRQAQDFGYWLQGQDPAILEAFPAQRFIRVMDVKEPRQNHAIYQDQVFRKDDPIWWRVINRDFGVPWGPWGWGCGHDVEDVDRAEAIQLGVMKPGDEIKPMAYAFNRGLQASIKHLDPDLIEKLKQAFGDQVIFEGDTMSWAAEGGGQLGGDQTKRLAGTLAPPTQRLAGTLAPPRSSPVSDALDLKVHGLLKDQVQAAIAAIDEVHDDGVLPEIPLRSTDRQYRGYFQPQIVSGQMTAKYIAVRADSDWPALTAVHEVGHFLDLDAIGAKGRYTDPALDDFLAAANSTQAIQRLRARLTAHYTEHVAYLLDPREIWARAYAQFVATRSSSPLLKKQLTRALEGGNQWAPDDFAPIEAALERLFKKLGWI